VLAAGRSLRPTLATRRSGFQGSVYFYIRPKCVNNSLHHPALETGQLMTPLMTQFKRVGNSSLVSI
jgi:hypothetical protein